MSRLVLTPIRSKAVLLEEVDDRIMRAAEAINGGLDRENLNPGYRLPVTQFVEQYAPIVLSGTILPGETHAVIGVTPSASAVIYPTRLVVATRWTTPAVQTVSLYYGPFAAPTSMASAVLGDNQLASGSSRILTAQTSQFGGYFSRYPVPADTLLFAKFNTGGGWTFPDGMTTILLHAKVQHTG